MRLITNGKIETCIIRIDKPIKTALPEVLSDIFQRSEVVSQAVSKFWSMKLSTEAYLGSVQEYPDHFEVQIIY